MKKIPKIIHSYWGGDRLPFMRYLTYYSLRKYNPEWRINLYRPVFLMPKGGRYALTGRDYTDRLCDLGVNVIDINFEDFKISNNISEIVKSDFLRWYLLGTEGGVWCDGDILFFRPLLDMKCAENSDTFVCFHEDLWSIGFLLASKNNKFYYYAHQQSYLQFTPGGPLKKFDGLQIIGCRLFLREFGKPLPLSQMFRNAEKRFPELKFHNISMTTVYPRDSLHAAEIYGVNDYIQPDTIGIHWYGGYKDSKTFVNLLEEDNYHNYNNIVCRTIGRVLEK